MEHEQNKRFNASIMNKSFTYLAVLIGIYHIIQTRWILIPIDQHKIIHVGSALVLIFLTPFIKKAKVHPKLQLLNKCVSLVLLLLTIGCSVFLVKDYHRIVTTIGRSDTFDLIVGGIMILVVLEGIRRTWGPVIPSVIILSLLYGYFGSYLPGILYHGGLKIQRLIAYSCIYFRGIYGSLVTLGSLEVFMFVLFGSFLEASGGIKLFISIATKLGAKLRSGPQQSAIIGSGLMGIISGSVAAIVATVGKVTIPIMVKNKVSREEAGAIEAVAATGGQLMPPVMGVTAFLIASSTNNLYFTVCKTALLPAIIFYFFLAYAAQIRALKLNIPITGKEDRPEENLLHVVKEEGYLLISVVVLIYYLAIYKPAAIAAFNAIISIIVLYIIKRFLVRKQFKFVIKDVYTFLIEAFSSGAKEGTKIGLMLSGLGIMVELFVVTGLAQKISFHMIELSGGNLILMLALIGITCIIFGMGLPTVGTYMVVSVLAAPSLVKLGIPLLTAHMFVFYYGLMAMVTPPVGVGAIVASGLAEGNYIKTALIATKLSLPGFVLPFFFIFKPAILWMDVSFFEAIVEFVFIISGFMCLVSLMEGYYFTKLNTVEMLFMAASCILLFWPGNFWSSIGLLLFITITVAQYLKWKKLSVEYNSV